MTHAPTYHDRHGHAHGGEPHGLWQMFKTAAVDWWNDNSMRWAASVAFYTMFSLAPILMIVVAIGGLFYGREAVGGAIVGQMNGLVGEQGAGVIQTAMASSYKEGSNVLMTVVSVALIIFGASGVFGELQAGLNSVWEVKPKGGRGFMGIVRDRVMSFGMVLAIGFLLLVSMVISAGLAAMGKFVGTEQSVLWHGVNLVVSLVVLAVLFALMFKYLPDAVIRWSDVWIGASVTAVLFTVGKYAIGFYLGRSTVASAYGAAGSLVVFLLWVYYSVQILFFGAELTQAYARQYGHGLKPAENAVSDERDADERTNKKA